MATLHSWLIRKKLKNRALCMKPHKWSCDVNDFACQRPKTLQGNLMVWWGHRVRLSKNTTIAVQLVSVLHVMYHTEWRRWWHKRQTEQYLNMEMETATKFPKRKIDSHHFPRTLTECWWLVNLFLVFKALHRIFNEHCSVFADKFRIVNHIRSIIKAFYTKMYLWITNIVRRVIEDLLRYVAL